MTHLARAARASGLRRVPVHNYIKEVSAAPREAVWPPRLPLREVVPDGREHVLQLIAKEHHRDDDRDGDNGNDECVFDQPLAGLVLRKKAHSAPSGSAAANRHASGRPALYGSGTSVPSVHDRRGGTRLRRPSADYLAAWRRAAARRTSVGAAPGGSIPRTAAA